MDSLFNAFLAMGLLVVIVLVIYLVDRVNSLEKETRRTSHPSAASAAPSDPWSGLSGKVLWDAMTGRPPAHLSALTLQELRLRYELVLHKHIQSLFDEGVRDGQRGMSGEPRNPRTIQTSQGDVESWLPTPQANALYKCGLDSTQLLGPDALAPVRQALDEAGQLLFSKAQLTLTEPLSASLMPLAPAAVAPAVPASADPRPAPGTGLPG